MGFSKQYRKGAGLETAADRKLEPAPKPGKAPESGRKPGKAPEKRPQTQPGLRVKRS